MYNEKVKEAYISDMENVGTVYIPGITAAFTRISEYENMLQKDLCLFTQAEIIDFYKSKLTASYNTLNVLNNRYEKYVDWCASHNLLLDGQNHYREIDKNTIMSCLNKGLKDLSIVSKEELFEYLNELINPCEKFIILASFEGWGGNNLSEICTFNLDMIDGKIAKLSSGRELEMSDELLALAYESAHTYARKSYKVDRYDRSFDENDPNVVKRTVQQKDYSDELFCIRTSSYIRRTCNKLDMPCLMPKNLELSGAIYTVKKMMAEKNIDAYACCKTYWPELSKRYRCFHNQGAVFYYQYKDYLNQ